MPPRNARRSPVLIGLVIGFSAVLSLSIGCEKSISPEVEAWRKSFLAEKEPEGAVTLTEAKTQLTEERDITIVGRVGSGGLDPFDKNKALFILSEAPMGEHAHESGHDEKECVFCRRKMEEAPLAHVELKNSDGSTIAMNAKDMLGLTEGRIIVVQGRGKYDAELDTVMLVAKSLFAKATK